MKVGDYVVYRDNSGSKSFNAIAKLNAIKGSTFTIRCEPDLKNLIVSKDIDRKDVVCNVGPKPIEGTVFGVSTSNLYRCRKPIEPFGFISYFCAPDKKVRSCLSNSFKLVAKKLKSKLQEWVINEPILFECRKLKPLVGGTYTAKYKDIALATIRINGFYSAIDTYPAVIAHEIGHHVFSKLNDEFKAKWLLLYSSYATPNAIESSQIKELKANLKDCEDLRSFQSELDDESKEVLKQCLKVARKCLKVKPVELNQLWESDKQKVLSMFPIAIRGCTYETVISSYALTNYNEMFAECFSMYIMGKDLPNEASTLMKRTLTFVKNSYDSD